MSKKRKAQILTFDRAMAMGSKKTDNTIINIYPGNERSKVTTVNYEFSTEEKSNSNVFKVSTGKYIRFGDLKEDDADKFHKVFKTAMKQIKRADILYYARIESFLQYILNYVSIKDCCENNEYRLLKQLLDNVSYNSVRFLTTVNCTATRVQKSVNKKYKNIDKYVSLQMIKKIILAIYSLKSCDEYPCMLYKDRLKWGVNGDLTSEVLFTAISLKSVDDVSSYLMNEYCPQNDDIKIDMSKFIYEPENEIGIYTYELQNDVIEKLKPYVIINESDVKKFSFIGFSKSYKINKVNEKSEIIYDRFVLNINLNSTIPIENMITSSIINQKIELEFSYDDIMNIRKIISDDIHKSDNMHFSDSLSFDYLYTKRKETETPLNIDVSNKHDIFFKSLNERGFNAYNKRVNKRVGKMNAENITD